MFYPRTLYPSLVDHLEKPEVTVLTGMRRAGKTTLLKQLQKEKAEKNSVYLDLERLDHRELFDEKNYETILRGLTSMGLQQSKKMVVFLDELQYAPQAPSAIKYLMDHHELKFVVTGSSSYYLKGLFRESLAGRKKLFELFPLNFGEYLNFRLVPSHPIHLETLHAVSFSSHEYHRLKGYYEEYIRYGGFPQVVLAQSREDKSDLLADILSSYMNVDIKTIADLRDERNLYTLIKLLASRVGSRLDISKLSRLSGLSRPTVMQYLDLLEKTYLIARIPVFTKNPDREIVKAQKLYFTDSGILNSLADVSSGAQFENTVYMQLARKGKVQYWARKIGKEIDFILEETVAYEVKETPTQQDVVALTSLSSQLRLRHARLIGRYPAPGFSDFLWGGLITW